MALNNLEQQALSYYISTNNVVIQQLPDFNSIVSWLDTPPNGSILNLIANMNATDRYKFFEEQNFTKVYSQCNKLLAEGNSFPVPTIYGQPDLSAIQLEMNCIELLRLLADYDLSDHTMQNLFIQLSREGRSVLSALKSALILLCMGNILGYDTTNRMLIECDSSKKRWQNMGLSSAPTISEVSLVFI